MFGLKSINCKLNQKTQSLFAATIETLTRKQNLTLHENWILKQKTEPHFA